MLRFEWDANKAERNLEKHGVSFEIASFVFENPLAVIFPDTEYSAFEPREILLGHKKKAFWC